MVATQGAQDLRGKALTHKGGEFKDRTAAFTEPLGAADEHTHDMIWELKIGHRDGGDQVAAAPLWRILLHQVVQNLLDKQGISTCDGTDCGNQLLRWTHQTQTADELVHLRFV